MQQIQGLLIYSVSCARPVKKKYKKKKNIRKVSDTFSFGYVPKSIACLNQGTWIDPDFIIVGLVYSWFSMQKTTSVSQEKIPNGSRDNKQNNLLGKCQY